MANPQKARGTRWESEVVRFLHAHGFPEARRNVQHGARDIGDIGGIPGFAIEAKDWQRPDWPAFVDQANREARNAGEPFGVAIVKRRRRPTSDAFVVMDLDTFVRLLHRILESPS